MFGIYQTTEANGAGTLVGIIEQEVFIVHIKLGLIRKIPDIKKDVQIREV